jgi:hypothetical protein
MQHIWNDHHRQIQEIDHRFKMRIRVLKIMAIVLFATFIIICANNFYI